MPRRCPRRCRYPLHSFRLRSRSHLCSRSRSRSPCKRARAYACALARACACAHACGHVCPRACAHARGFAHACGCACTHACGLHPRSHLRLRSCLRSRLRLRLHPRSCPCPRSRSRPLMATSGLFRSKQPPILTWPPDIWAVFATVVRYRYCRPGETLALRGLRGRFRLQNRPEVAAGLFAQRAFHGFN